MLTWRVEDHYAELSNTFDLKPQLQLASETKRVDPPELDLETKPLAGNALLLSSMTVLFALIDSDILLPVHIADCVIIGRQDYETNEKADIDLMPYGGRN